MVTCYMAISPGPVFAAIPFVEVQNGVYRSKRRIGMTLTKVKMCSLSSSTHPALDSNNRRVNMDIVLCRL